MKKEIAPQKGPQFEFLASSADITIYGGAAGGGKTCGMLCGSRMSRTSVQYSSDSTTIRYSLRAVSGTKV